MHRASPRAAECGRQAVELAAQHGWADEPAVGVACVVLGVMLVWQGRLEEAEPWVQRAERTLRAEAQPGAGLAIYYVRGVLDLAHGQDAEALAAFRAAERLAGMLAAPNLLVTAMRAFLLQTLARHGETECAEQALAGFGDRDRDCAEIRIALAVLRLARDDPHAAMAALAPVLDGSAPLIWPAWLAQAFLLEAIARDTAGDSGAAGRALERALDLAEPDGVLLPFLLHPAPGLLERQAGHRTAHAALITEIQSLLAGSSSAAPPAGPQPPLEALSDSEIRVLRYLPTNLTAPEIAGELSVSRNTVKTHMRNVYAKLGTHRRAEAVAHARDLGLLATLRGQALTPAGSPFRDHRRPASVRATGRRRIQRRKGPVVGGRRCTHLDVAQTHRRTLPGSAGSGQSARRQPGRSSSPGQRPGPAGVSTMIGVVFPQHARKTTPISALDVLRERGLIVTLPAKGTFITERD